MARHKAFATCGVLLGLLVGGGGALEPIGVDSGGAWDCPPGYPVKGNFTTWNGEPCIYHVPGGRLYERTRPERCFATEAEARAVGCRKSKV